MKTKYLFFGLVACLLISLSSCEEELLDIPRKGALPVNEFYKSDADAEAALATVYRYVWTTTYQNSNGIYPFIKNIMSDDHYSGGQKRNDQPLYEAINEFNYASDNNYVLSYFQGLYNLIYRCNLIIDNFKEDNYDTNIKKAAVAQSKVWRAWAYTELITLWGTPPLVDHILKPSEYQQGNGDPVALWNLVETDLKDAISSGHLPEKTTVNDKIAKVTKGYAQALLGKAYVFMTYSLTGGAYGGSQAEAANTASKTSPYWAKAAATFEELINSGKYALYTGNYFNIMKMAADWSSENMFEFNRIFNSASTGNNLPGGWESYMIGWDGPRMTGYGSYQNCTRASNFMTPRREVYDAMVEWEGINGVRVKGSIMTYDQIVAEMNIAMTSGTINTVYANDGVFDLKQYRDEKEEKTGHATEKNYPLMRYSEVLLLAAEANLMAGNQSKADTYMNQVRNRALLDPITDVTLSDIQKEKRCELYFEGARQYDIIRWGLAYDLLKDQGKTVPYFTAYTASATKDPLFIDSKWTGTATVGEITYELGVKDETINTVYGFKKGKHELLPFPQGEMLLSGPTSGGNLVQNPGW
jgi:starch-binding outer membrane protein, SusD/RagB family